MIFGKRSLRAARGRRTADNTEKEPAAGNAEAGSAVIRTPPMKPFARISAPLNLAPAPATPKTVPPATAAPATAAPAVAAQRPAEIIARHAPRGILPDPRQGAGQGPGQIPGHTLVVGRDIRLTGEIRACERLVVEGSVEAELTDTRSLEIAESGHFRGSATVGECVVSGSFDGELTVSGLLAVRAGGRVGGAVRYTEIEVERGGRITGRADLQGPQEVRPAARSLESHGTNSRATGAPGFRPA